MNLQELDTQLKDIDAHFEYVNHGGCACVASMLAKHLRDIFPIMRITSCSIWISSIDTDLDQIRPNLSNNMVKSSWYDNGVHFGHVWVEIFVDGDWHVLDSTGVHTRDEMYDMWGVPAKGSFTIDEITALSEDGGWNTMFDRSQLPDMQEFITEMIH